MITDPITPKSNRIIAMPDFIAVEMRSFREYMMRVLMEMLVRIKQKIRCGIGTEGDDSSARFFWIILCVRDFENSKFVIA